jgi:hypothetical protein
MGLLDDAIRDHLELKRRHGADPGEVSKLEHEAFGPIQREDALEVGPAPVFEDEDEEDLRAEHELAQEEEDAYEESELEADEEWELEHPGDRAAEAGAAAPPAVDEDLDDPAPGGSVRVDLVDDDVAPPAPPAATPEAGEHDELEETPEFLEETPEHDRLWFEQKPPRDFDF